MTIDGDLAIKWQDSERQVHPRRAVRMEPENVINI